MKPRLSDQFASVLAYMGMRLLFSNKATSIIRSLDYPNIFACSLLVQVIEVALFSRANLAAHTPVHDFQYTKCNYYIIMVLIDLIRLYTHQYSAGAQNVFMTMFAMLKLT